MFWKKQETFDATIFVEANGIKEYWNVARKVGWACAREARKDQRWVLDCPKESARWLNEDRTKARIFLENITEKQFKKVQAMKEVFATNRTV